MSAVTRESWSAIGRIIDAQSAAWCAGDSSALARDAMPDIMHTGLDGRLSAGIRQFVAEHERILSTTFKGSQLAQEYEHFKFLSAEICMIHCLATITGISRDPADPERPSETMRARILQVMVLNDGAWRVQAFHAATI